MCPSRTPGAGRNVLTTLTVSIVLACGDDQTPTASGSTSESTTAETSPTDTASIGETTGTTRVDTTSADASTTGECEAVGVTEPVGFEPADIVLVVDNSASMELEAAATEASINAFADQLAFAAIDAHIVLISADDSEPAGICVPSPLGSGACPDDTNLPGYLHIVDLVGSNDALQKILEHYATWAPQLREGSNKHLVVVTDDDSALSAADFDAMFSALDPALVGYTFHAIASPDDPMMACIAQTSCCPALVPIPAALGQVYIDLAMLTGGVFGNVCEDVGASFDEISAAIASGAARVCEYEIPSPPGGMSFDPDQVNVDLSEMDSTLSIGRVDDPAQCAAVSNGWYYDDPSMPTRIVLCPQTCDALQDFLTPEVDIAFGCATVPAE